MALGALGVIREKNRGVIRELILEVVSETVPEIFLGLDARQELVGGLHGWDSYWKTWVNSSLVAY